jgi:hypothetical protein
MAGTACAGFRITLRRGGMDAASRAGGGVRQAWRRRNERDLTCVAANDTQRAAVFSLQVRRAHQQLRDELARIGEALGGDAQRPLHRRAFRNCDANSMASPRSWSRISDTKNAPSAPPSTTACQTPDGRGPCSSQASRSIRCPETVAGNAQRTQSQRTGRGGRRDGVGRAGVGGFAMVRLLLGGSRNAVLEQCGSCRETRSA